MRARGIKPGFFKNELLGTCNPLTAILFAGLWTLADREGRLEDRPLRIKAEIFPYRESLDINGSLTELVQMDFICRYEAGGIPLIQIVNFRKHQTPHKTEKASTLPAPPSNILENKMTCSATVKPPDSNRSLTAPLPPDLLITDLLITDSPQCVRDPDFFGKCFAVATTHFPGLTPCNSAIIGEWERAGYDFERHVKPVLDSAKAKGARPRSFNFFTGAIEDSAKAKVTSAPPLPEPSKPLTKQEIEQQIIWYRKHGIQHLKYNPEGIKA